MIRRAFAAGFGASLLTPRAFAAYPVATPAQTEGPFYPAGFPADSDNDLVQVRGQAARAMGTVLHLQGRVFNVGGSPVGAVVEIWQCDSRGLYDHPRQSMRESRDTAFQGYGRVVTDADSRYTFRTLKPVAYPGRAPHIHLKVETADGRKLTSQFYLAGDPRNAGDVVWRNAAWGEPGRQAMIDMRLEPANGLEPGAVTTWMDIVMPFRAGPRA
ncbi:MAG TPA: protocatechuate 3,4-dioxygenase [Reyranella sp.]|nr:protocatechuate 3,4-dioxygenase [Reyranella sp.]